MSKTSSENDCPEVNNKTHFKKDTSNFPRFDLKNFAAKN